MRQKSITLRLSEEEYMAFTTVCNEKGYSKSGKIREFIRNMVKAEIDEVELSAAEWEKVRKGIREIEGGQFATFEELKRDLARRGLADKKNRGQGKTGYRVAQPGDAAKNPGRA